MDRLVTLLVLDLRLMLRHHVLAAVVFTTLIYLVLVASLPAAIPSAFLAFLVFFAPVMIGVLFVGALVLAERAEGSLLALVVSPLSPRIYLWSKILSLTALASLSGLVISWVGYPAKLDPTMLGVGLVLSSFGAVLVGLNIVLRCRRLATYVLIAAMALAALSSPAAALARLVPAATVDWIPSSASLTLFIAAADPGALRLKDWSIAVLYLLVWLGAGWIAVDRAFSLHSVAGAR